MLRVASRACGGPGGQDVALPAQGPYGVHGAWFLDFACPAAGPKAGGG